MNSLKEMIIIDGKIVTNDISCCKYNAKNRTYMIKYKGSPSFYNFSAWRVEFITNPDILNPYDYKFYVIKNKRLLPDVQWVYEFKSIGRSYYHVIFHNRRSLDFDSHQLKKFDKHSFAVVDYMKEVAAVISLSTDDGKKLLCEQMRKIEVDSLDISLANYLKLSDELLKENNIETLIFPFGCNSSQYVAVENAIYNKISVIEGPPGTGKTQTILNIIANIIVRDMNCQVVSNNNAAIENIDEKLKKYDFSFFSALLGKKENKDLFVLQQDTNIPDFDDYTDLSMDDTTVLLKNTSQLVRNFYDAKKELASLIQKKKELELEYRYFKELVKGQNIQLNTIKRYNVKKIRLLWNELLSLEKISVWNKLKYILIYGIGNFEFYNDDLDIILKLLQDLIYLSDIDEVDKNIKEKEAFINANKEAEEKFIKLSMDYFKKYLSIKYKKKRRSYSSSEIWKNSGEFLNDYPVILSTTYSSRNTVNNDFKFDYIIMDEASQIDVVTGTLALSSAKYAVVIGDEKQLPNVIPNDVKRVTDNIFSKYDLDKSYSYSLNSFLTSVKNTIKDISSTMLVEHYRCHPKIIDFCNKKFYNNELVIMTKDNGEEDVIKVIKTNKGNHSREKANQRQVDIIKEIVKNFEGDVGIIAPYNNQVQLIRENVDNALVSTIHKFQGREKDTIIISTVDDEVSDFVGDAKILNVAVSRAKQHLYFIVTGNTINNSNVSDFIDYVNYNNFEIINSKIYSSFDLLYKQYELERLEFFKKHNRIFRYDSENIIYYLIGKIVSDYDNLSFHFHQSLNDLIKDKSLLNDEELKYVKNPNTHIDFYIFNNIGDRFVLAIEIDGYKYHKKGTKQYERDLLKNGILEKYNLPYIRLKTNGSNEEKNIREKLDEILNSK